MQSIDIVLVGYDIILVFALGEVGKHRWVLGLGIGQLVVDQVPNRFIRGLIACSDALVGELTPGALACNT